ncbi:MAG TPA: glycine cleavage system protein H [Methylomirabilota bacterium]|nr:glycine cleavage system protein H [Methylomirabilota bacterium]
MARVEAYELPDDLWYEPREHLWLRATRAPGSGGWDVTVGVDTMGADALGEVVYVQLLPPGGAVSRGQALGSLEAEKMVRPVLAPVSGKLVEVNRELERAPRLLNTDPYGRGWLVRIRAERWQKESTELLHGAPAVEAWARAELGTHEGRQ